VTPSAQIAKVRAHLIARYRLANVPGRPEEHRATERTGRVPFGNDHRVSVQYASHSVRVRAMVGRKWTHTVDFQVGDPDWQAKIHPELDNHFEYVDPTRFAR
jgi:hypothetical protein